MNTLERILSNVSNTARRVVELIQNYDFDTFLIGVRLPDNIDPAEKKTIAVEIGRIVSRELEKKVDFSMPDITVIVDYKTNIDNPSIELDVRSLYVYGEYQKLERDIPQTKWICPKCRGKGCPYCNFMGKLYPTSVEEEIGKPLLDLTGGIGTKFHGAGREDRDALMRGWRPFVIEILHPVVRKLDWSYVESLINNKTDKVRVRNLRPSNKEEVIKLKAAKFDKTYEAIVVCESKYEQDKLKEIESKFVNVVIKQRTPTRVAHRRADKVRERKVYFVKCEPIDDKSFRAVIKAESGTYIKELVSGDNGRTKPNISETLGVPCVVKELNVLEVHAK